ncbi:MAG: TlpA disulfide reductase family protein [Bacteroidota bacterium]
MRYLSLVFFLVLLIACTQESPSEQYTILRGSLPTGTTEGEMSYGGNSYDLTVAADGTFHDTLMISGPNYVDLAFGQNQFWVYAAPGDEVVVAVDSLPTFSGSNAAINGYLYQDVLAQQAMYASFEKIYRMPEADYVQYEDSLRADKLARMAKLPTGSEAFQEFHRKGIDYEYKFNAAKYPMYHSYHFRDYEPTEILTDVYAEVDLDNEEDAQRYGTYRSLVSHLIDERVEKIIEKDTTLSILEGQLMVLTDIQSPTIRQEQLNYALYNFDVNVENPEAMRDRMLALAGHEETKEAINERYEVISRLQPGAPSPTFDYENFTGGTTKLADLKGKYVYVDVWATWCGPCIQEIPHLKKVEEDFHDADIEFVSISIDELASRDRWRNMIEKRELGGTQLLADKDWESDFIRSYGIRGIPHFILLDDEGNIVSAQAERPSDPSLRERLEKLAR